MFLIYFMTSRQHLKGYVNLLFKARHRESPFCRA